MAGRILNSYKNSRSMEQKMTDLIYQEDSYINNFEAQITEIDPDHNGIILNRTAFYPGGGG